MEKRMNVKQIVRKYLSENGFDGLVSTEHPCGCMGNDLFQCEDYGQIDCYCVPAYKMKPHCENCKTICDGGDGGYRMTIDKEQRS